MKGDRKRDTLDHVILSSGKKKPSRDWSVSIRWTSVIRSRFQGLLFRPKERDGRCTVIEIGGPANEKTHSSVLE